MTLTVTKIKEVLENKYPTTNTKKIHFGKLEKIRKDMKEKSFDFIKTPEKVIDFLEKKYNKHSTLKAYFISIVSTFKDVPEVSQEVKDIYNKKMLEYRDKNNTQIKENKPSIKENENFITFKEIQDKSMEIYETIKDDIENIQKMNNKRKMAPILKKYSDFLTLYYLSHTPPTRLESAEVYITDKEYKKKKENYIQIDAFNAAIYHINNYKNIKKMGEIKVRFGKELSKIITDHYNLLKTLNLNIDNKYYLFLQYDRDGNPKKFKNNNSFGQYIKRLFKKYFNKPITINDLRHVYTTEIMKNENYMNMSINEKEEIHRKLLHNKETGEQYFKLYEFQAPEKYKKDIDYENKEELRKILEKHGYRLN